MTEQTANLRYNLGLDELTTKQVWQYATTLKKHDNASIALGDASREQLIDAICLHFENKG